MSTKPPSYSAVATTDDAEEPPQIDTSSAYNPTSASNPSVPTLTIQHPDQNASDTKRNEPRNTYTLPPYMDPRLMDCGWQMMISPEGNIYYQNNITKVTRWTPPVLDPSESSDTASVVEMPDLSPHRATQITATTALHPNIKTESSVESSSRAHTHPVSRIKIGFPISCMCGFPALVLIVIGLIVGNLASTNCGWIGLYYNDISYDELCAAEQTADINSSGTSWSSYSWCDTKHAAIICLICCIFSAIFAFLGVVLDYNRSAQRGSRRIARVTYSLSVIAGITGIVVWITMDEACARMDDVSDSSIIWLIIGYSLALVAAVCPK